VKVKVNLKDLQRIVKEEVQKLQEQVDHESIKDVVTHASKLLGAIDAFRQVASNHVVNAITPNLDNIEKTLEDMVNSPASYVVPAKPEPKKVSLRAVKD